MSGLSPIEATQKIKAEALRLGFAACGVAVAESVPRHTARAHRSWVEAGYHGSMSYMERNHDLRCDPTALLPGTRSIVSVAMNYYPERRQPSDLPQFATYAYGRDYHKVVKKRLDGLLRFIQTDVAPDASGRSFTDSAPLMERYWAWRAGLGWIGKNGLLIIPRAGSFFFLGELLLDLELVPDEPMQSQCGSCTRCLDACPTGALIAPQQMDARRCISYLTIEQAEEIAPDLAQAMGNRVYGCDECQRVCPWNRFALPSQEPDFSIRWPLLSLSYGDYEQMSPEEFERLFAGSPIRRAGLSGLKRSIRAVKGNQSPTQKD